MAVGKVEDGHVILDKPILGYLAWRVLPSVKPYHVHEVCSQRVKLPNRELGEQQARGDMVMTLTMNYLLNGPGGGKLFFRVEHDEVLEIPEVNLKSLRAPYTCGHDRFPVFPVFVEWYGCRGWNGEDLSPRSHRWRKPMRELVAKIMGGEETFDNSLGKNTFIIDGDPANRPVEEDDDENF